MYSFVLHIFFFLFKIMFIRFYCHIITLAMVSITFTATHLSILVVVDRLLDCLEFVVIMHDTAVSILFCYPGTQGCAYIYRAHTSEWNCWVPGNGCLQMGVFLEDVQVSKVFVPLFLGSRREQLA